MHNGDPPSGRTAVSSLIPKLTPAPLFQAGIDGEAGSGAFYRDTNGDFAPLAWLQLGGWSCLSIRS